MVIHNNAEELRIIDENAFYVLGMYDLYETDQEIIGALKAKGIDSLLILKIMQKVKIQAYAKRVQQAKRKMMASGCFISICLLTYVICINLPDAATLLHGTREGEGFLVFIFKFYREIFYFAFFAAILVLITSYKNFTNYSKLLVTSEP